MEKLAIVILTLAAFAFNLRAGDVKTVKAAHRLIVPTSMTLDEAMQIAVDRAKADAIANEFGTEIKVEDQSFDIITSDAVKSTQYRFGSQKVHGEWVETLTEPEFSVEYLKEDKQLVVEVFLKGRIRKIDKVNIPFTINVICKTPRGTTERLDFKDGDQLIVKFQSPVSGYLTIFLDDYNSDTVYAIYPYKESRKHTFKVTADQVYTLFDPSAVERSERYLVDEYIMQCEEGRERNDLYFVFSERPFNLPTMTRDADGIPPYINRKGFDNWISTLKQNTEVFVTSKSLNISAK